MWKKPKCILLSERNQYEKATYCMVLTIWHLGRSKKLWRKWKHQCLLCLMGERDEQSEHRWFLGQGNFIWYYNGGYMSYHICQKSWNVQLRVNSGIKYGLWVMMIYKFRSTNYNKCRSLVEDFDHGDMHM